MTRRIAFNEALREATELCMAADPRVFVVGLGVPDPMGIFGTTVGLREKFDADRVRDMPVSENAMTGIVIGAALTGSRPILTHQRLDNLVEMPLFGGHVIRLRPRDGRIGAVLLAWGGMQLSLGLLSPIVDNWAHLGGFLAGAVFGSFLPSRLFGRKRSVKP